VIHLSNSKTFVGIIISVAVLTVAAVFTVYMFVQAGNAQNKARDLDRAVLAAQSVIEEYKAGAAPSSKIYFSKDFEVINQFKLDGFSLVTDIDEGPEGFFDVVVTVAKNESYFLDRSDKVVFSLETIVRKP